MNQTLTLDHISPRMNLRQKTMALDLVVTAVAVLIFSYIWTGIDPIKLYHKRENAFTYLFGRQITTDDQEYARNQARRIPDITAFQEALTDLKRKYREEGKEVDLVQIQKEVRELADRRLEQMPAAKREKLVQEEYERILDEKRGGFFPRKQPSPTSSHT